MQAERPILANGIVQFITRPDLADRFATITLKRMLPAERKERNEMRKAFKTEHPRLLGAILSAVSAGLARTDFVKPASLPRMADHAVWVRKTAVFSLTWCIGSGPIGVWHPCEPPPALLLEAAGNPNAVCVSHGFFDYLAWHCLLVPQGWPPVPLPRWSDTMARCRVYRVPASLEKAALRLELGIKKDPRGKRLILKAHLQARGEGPPLTDQEIQEFDSYARTDASVLRELDRLPPELPTLKRGAYGLDVSMNDRGLPFDLDLVRRLVPRTSGSMRRCNRSAGSGRRKSPPCSNG
jgi:hypothetical protein